MWTNSKLENEEESYCDHWKKMTLLLFRNQAKDPQRVGQTKTVKSNQAESEKRHILSRNKSKEIHKKGK